MKHYTITKQKNGWFKGEVRLQNRTETYNCFFNHKEAEHWCYAKIRYYYGKDIARQEF